MFNSPVLDLVILLSFTYFIGSLILSAINEALAGTLRLRQADLKKGIYNFFLSSSWRLFVKSRFFESPNIQTLMRKKGRLPSYIPARNFVLAIVEQLNAAFYKKGVVQPLTKDDGNPILPLDMVVMLDTISKQVGALPTEHLAPNSNWDWLQKFQPVADQAANPIVIEHFQLMVRTGGVDTPLTKMVRQG